MHTSPPRIALSMYREKAAWGVWSEPADLLPASYAVGVREAGGVALMLPPGAPETAGVALDAVHGLVLTGGPDIDPARYGSQRAPATGRPHPERDDWEIALANEAVRRDLPVLAICRGLQVLNVALGGDLRQHLPDEVGTDLHCPTIGAHGRHDVALDAGSAVGRLLGDHTQVATYHHQAVGRLGADLVATGWAADGVVEAVELPGCAWVVGVQWHPEVHAGAPLFEAFVAAAAGAAASRAG